MRILVAGMVLLAALAGAVTAQASTLIAPSDGAKFAGGETAKFVWEWPDAQPWEGRIVFSQEPDPSGAAWFDVKKIIQYSRSTDNSPLIQLDSKFTRGDWYWRVCNYPIDASDDLCHYTDKNVRGFTMTSTAIADLTKPVAKRLLIKAIKRRKGGSSVRVSSCRSNERNVVECIGKWRAHGRNYTANACKISRNLRTSKTTVRIAGVRSDSR